MMIGMMVQMVAMMGSTEAHIILVTFSKRQVLYLIQYFPVKPLRFLRSPRTLVSIAMVPLMQMLGFDKMGECS